MESISTMLTSYKRGKCNLEKGNILHININVTIRNTSQELLSKLFYKSFLKRMFHFKKGCQNRFSKGCSKNTIDKVRKKDFQKLFSKSAVKMQ